MTVTWNISPTIKCIGNIDTFSNIGPHEVLYVLSRSQYGAISDTTHIKTIFSFWTSIGKHFIGNAGCSSDDSLTKLIHILHFCIINNIPCKPQKKTLKMLNLVNEGLGNGSHPTIRKIHVQKGTNMTGEVTWSTLWLENCSHSNMTQSSVLHPVSFISLPQRNAYR
jgi:hypothetical protein